MSDFLKLWLSLSFSGSLLILLLLCFKGVLKNRVSRRWQYYIWLVVIARLLLPVTPEVSLTGSAFQTVERVVSESYEASMPDDGQQNPAVWTDSKGVELTNLTELTELKDAYGQKEPDSSGFLWTAGSVLWNHLWLVWAAAALVLLIRKITVYQSFVRYVRAGGAAVSDPELLDRLAEIGGQAGVKRPVELCVNPLLSSPLLIGFFRPCIVLPSAALSEEEFRYTALHELTHYRRKDMFYKWLAQIALCLHWFNPLVYLMTKEISRACELSCDEAVLSVLADDERKGYGAALLEAMNTPGVYREELASVTLSENKTLLKERLSAIMGYKKRSKIASAAAVALTAVMFIGAAASGAYAEPILPAITKPGTTRGAMNDDYEEWDTGYTGYSYTQAGYYQEPYVFDYGWNLNDDGFKSYGEKARVTLTDGTSIPISFDDSCKEAARDKKVLAALTQLTERLRKEYAGSTMPLQKPIVVSVEYVGGSELSKLAEDYYSDGKMTRFSAIFPALSEAVKWDFCGRMIEDGKLTFLSSCSRAMTAEMIADCAEKAYAKGALTLFSVLVPEMSDSQRDTWAARASRDGKNTFLSVVTNYIQKHKE